MLFCDDVLSAFPSSVVHIWKLHLEILETILCSAQVKGASVKCNRISSQGISMPTCSGDKMNPEWTAHVLKLDMSEQHVRQKQRFLHVSSSDK